jgi:hypothetical protein
MSNTALTGGHAPGFAANLRTDRWWVGPVLTFLGLLGFVVYSTWAAFEGQHYWFAGGVIDGFGGYLSPMYSPVLFRPDEIVAGGVPVGHAWLSESWLSWWPSFLPQSPAFLILVFPGAFRFTCYYYRKAYYRAFTGTPPACSVGALPQAGYKGETRWLLFQNLHRYALYFALVFIGILGFDAVQGFFRGGQLGVGVGSIVLTVNVLLLAGYTFGCHSFRHLIGGKLNKFSGCAFAQMRHGAWSKCTALNERHMLFAWMSLFWVGFTDVYVRLVSMGTWTDYNTWG